MKILDPFPMISFNNQVGYDTANKKMLLRVAEALWFVVGQKQPLHFNPKLKANLYIPKWTHVITEMLLMEGRNPNHYSVRGYYSTIRAILKDIKVIQYDSNGGLVPGSNWDRFFDEDKQWNWFIADTNRGGIGTIVFVTPY